MFIDRDSLSIKSLSCKISSVCRVHDSSLPSGTRFRQVFITLTYSDNIPWQVDQIKNYLKIVRSFLARKKIPFRYVWVVEATKKLRPHYHILVWLPYRVRIPKPDVSGHWNFGLSRIEQVRVSASAYIAKYISKMADNLARIYRPAPGARTFGAGGFGSTGRLAYSYLRLPSWAKKLHVSSATTKSKKISGGYYFYSHDLQLSGFYPSPHHVIWTCQNFIHGLKITKTFSYLPAFSA